MHVNSFTRRMICVGLAASVFLTSCSSTTLIQSNPSGAKVYLNGEPVGVTPYEHRDTRIVGSTTSVRLEQDGYQKFYGSFSRDEEVDVGAIIGGIFVLVPFLWTMKYNPSHTYELIPAGQTSSDSLQQRSRTMPATKADRLRELKKLLDDKIITQAEYEAEKKKILDEK